MHGQRLACFIDDDAYFLESINDLIEHPAFEIRTFRAANGYKAIDEVIKIKPDVLFIDFNIPRANGGQILAVLRSIRELSRIPIYFLTGYAREEITPFLKGIPYKDILSKGTALNEALFRILDDLAQAA